MATTWNGDAVKAKVTAAAKHAIDRVMSEASIDAKKNHPGWKNVTSTAEGSVRPVQFAEEKGTKVVGVWGSVDVNYVIWLEVSRGSFLRTSADRNYKNLSAYIKEHLV